MRSTTETEEIIEVQDTGIGGEGLGGAPGGPGGGHGREMPAVPQRVYVTGMVMGLAAMLMFFMALTSAYIVRKGMAGDWHSITPPGVLWINTLVLLASSATIQKARRQLAQLDFSGFRHWWGVTTALGLLFLAGQLLAWRQLVASGIYLASNPSSSFFYVLTAAHGLHLLGGIVALLVVGLRSWSRSAGTMTRGTATEIAALYWHFLDGLWIFLFLLLNLGR